MKKITVPAWIMLAASAVLGVVCYLVLPETVVTQFSPGSKGVTTMPKLLAVIIPFLLGGGGAVAALLGKEDEKARRKALLVSGAGIVVFIVMLLVNTLGR